MTEQKTGSVSYMRATINGREVEDFKTLARETGEFEGIITFSDGGWKQTLVVKFLPRGKRWEVPFRMVDNGDIRSGVLSKLPVVGALTVTLP